ncbi:MAG: sugar phosphate isomerase/epimerase [Acidobacteriota bacterium]|nr:MAG: sugar phosphate isomerase/epimerase [Acidobacteriota bacterium]
MNRREFINQTIIAGAAVTLSGSIEIEAAKVNWEVGCFNRPWTRWSYDQALKEIKAAGYKTTGLLSRTREEPFIGSDASPEYLAGLRSRLAASGLKVNMGALRSRHNTPLEDSIRDVRKQLDHAHQLGLKYVMSFGADKPEEFAHYYKVMNDASAYAGEKGIKLVMKPHGGISGSSDEILNVIREVNHRNFSIWYDAGNIIHYTGKDPVAEIAPIAKHITGFCAKDCGELKGDVMIQFGAGKVDFPAVFKALKTGGFNGPVMVECCKIGATPEETTANARANREFLEKVLASI